MHLAQVNGQRNSTVTETSCDASVFNTTSLLVGTAYGIAGRRLKRAFCKGCLIYRDRLGYGPLAIERHIQNMFLKGSRSYLRDGGKDGHYAGCS